MDSVYLVIEENGDYSNRNWEVKKVCSSYENPREIVYENVAKLYLKYNRDDSPFLIEKWQVDGDVTRYSDRITIEQVAIENNEVQHKLEIQKEKQHMIQQLKEEESKRVKCQEARSKLDEDILSGKLTPEEYRTKIDLNTKFYGCS